METPKEHKPKTSICKHVPVEILMEILLRLPVKSLVRFTIVCRSWYSLIASSIFITTHMKRNPVPNSNVLVIPKKFFNNQIPSKIFCSVLKGTTFVDIGKHRFPFLSLDQQVPFVAISDSCHGLLCVANLVKSFFGRKLFLYNPTTSHAKTLFSSSFNRDVFFGRAELFSFLGFGFCQSTNQHEIVRINYVMYKESPMQGKVPLDVEVYSVREDSWRNIKANIHCIADHINHRSVTCNGAIHWLASRNVEGVWDAILSFDPSNEVFYEMQLPTDYPSLTYGTLLVFEGLLAFFVKAPNDRENERIKYYETWLMEEYNVSKSWTKMFVVKTHRMILEPLGFTKSGKLILRMDDRKLALWDPENQQFRNLHINGDLYHIDTAFTESLALFGDSNESSQWHRDEGIKCQ